jgi:hypothetical protein
MPPLETLFRLELEFHRRLRTQAPGTEDTQALQSGYEPLIRSLGSVTGRDVERVHARLALTADARDLRAARDSLKRLLGVSSLDT